ncbi:MAG: hypothetical protein U1F47_02235 [Hyphomicrobiales bacterium]
MSGLEQAMAAQPCPVLQPGVVALNPTPASRPWHAANLASCKTVEIVDGALDQGWASAAPYSVIVVEGGSARLRGSCWRSSDRMAAGRGGGRRRCLQGHNLDGAWRRHHDARAAFDASVAALPGFARKELGFRVLSLWRNRLSDSLV